MDSGSTALLLLALIQATWGQTVTVEGPTAVEQGSNTVYTCTLTGGSSTSSFIWSDNSLDPTIIIFVGEGAIEKNPKHDNFNASVAGTTSTMTIMNTQIEDEGEYRCTAGTASDDVVLAVEVRSTRTLSLASTIVNNVDMYEATCEALEGRPAETITWMLDDGGSPCSDPVVTNPTAGQDLFSTISVCTFQADIMDNEKTLKCVISGHQEINLNGEEEETLDHNAPALGIVVVAFQETNRNLRVSCNIADANQPKPTIRNYYIYSDGILIHESTAGVNSYVVLEADYNLSTNFTCVAGNYQGNTSSDPTRYDPTRTTIPPTMGPEPLSAGAIAGIAIAALLVIIIIVVLIIVFVLKPDCVSGLGSSSGGGGGPKKHGSSSVGSSNGNDKNDVEAPLKGVNEVVTEDNFKPTPQPRQSSIQHTNENPGMAEYAMVDRKPKASSGGDMPDTRGNGAGQNEQPGMHYADLDLTPGAGHTEEKVPQNPDNVVVYSSILV